MNVLGAGGLREVAWGVYTHPPGNSYEFQSKGLRKFVFCKLLILKGMDFWGQRRWTNILKPIKRKAGSRSRTPHGVIYRSKCNMFYGKVKRDSWFFLPLWRQVEKEGLTAGSRRAASGVRESPALWRPTSPRSSWFPRAKSFPSRPAPVSVHPG